jgi:hypothetical protein
VVDPHILAPQSFWYHLDGNKYEQDPAINYVEFFGLAVVVGGTMGDAIHGRKECENLYSCLLLCKIETKLFLGHRVFSPYKIPRRVFPT